MAPAKRRTNENTEWWVELLCILFDMPPKEIWEAVGRTSQEEVVAKAISEALDAKIITANQLSILEDLCGRNGEKKTLKQIAQERNNRKDSMSAQKLHAATNLSGSQKLIQLVAGIPHQQDPKGGF